MLRIIKFGLPIAAIVCLGALGPTADAAPSKKSSSSAKARSGKKSSASKKSKNRSSGKTGKSKNKKREAAVSSAALDWIDELPEVELPEESGPVEDELLEPVPESPAP